MNGVIAIPLPGCPIAPDVDGDDCSVLPDFLAGPENRLVETAVRSVLGDRPDGYNPLVLYGPSGSGKSHLAQGLATKWKARHRRRRVEYTTAADFARELTDAIKTQATDELRNRYRKAALLVLEDVDRLAGKNEAQEELVHTVDALLAGGRRMVVTAAAAPARLPGIAPGLQSRLISGLTVPLAPPGPAARLAILQRLAQMRKIKLPQPAAEILAAGLTAMVPGLVAAMVQLEVPARLLGGTVDAAAAEAFLARRNGSRQAGVGEIASATARLFSLKLSELRGPSRRQAVATARAVAMYLARQLGGRSLQQIGRYFGGRDHTTVMYGCRKIEDMMEHDPAIRRAVQQLRERWQDA